MISRKPKYPKFFKVTNTSFFYFLGVVLWRCLGTGHYLSPGGGGGGVGGFWAGSLDF